ncbi:MAG: histidine-type phosphatase, partial [Bacteroidales bacterium]|nr:histidine-type phosphatase [Bacteroidales bacterium]
MQRLLTFLTGIFLSSVLLFAQQYDALDQVKADIRKVYGMEGPHRLDEFGTLSKAPAGYKPFYISHYGRHGSRYAWNSETYKLIQKVFAKADEKNLLTPYGKEFAAKYEDFYMKPYINAGDLVPLGYDQHQAIGKFTYEQFPQVFKGRKKVDALSSTGQRCIVSMGAFTTGLMSGNP